MRAAGATNFKWSMADVDFVVGLARAGRTAAEICDRLRGRNTKTVPIPPFSDRQLVVGPIEATPDEIRELCWQSGITVRMAPRLCS